MRTIKFKLKTSKTPATRDCTLGKVYQGTLYPKGTKRSLVFFGASDQPTLFDTISFIDDVGDGVKVSIDGSITYTEIKPRAKLRQFDIKFKRKAVKTVQKLREEGVHGDVKRFLDMTGLTYQHISYWEAQVSSGVLKKSNAVSFSTNPSAMIRG